MPTRVKVAIGIFAALTFINTDFLLYGLIYFKLASPLNALLISASISIIEMPLWYWSINCLYKEFVKGSEIGQKWRIRFDRFLHPKSLSAKILIRGLETGGAIGLFFFSMNPLPFGRTVCVMSCVVTGLEYGLIPIMAGNLFHYYLAVKLLT